MNLHFANAWALFLLWLAPLFALGLRLARRRRRRALESFVSATMRRRLAPSADVARHVWQGALTTLGLTLLLLAASRPQWGEREAPAFRRGRDLEKTVLARAIWMHLQKRILVYTNKTVLLG